MINLAANCIPTWGNEEGIVKIHHHIHSLHPLHGKPRGYHSEGQAFKFRTALHKDPNPQFQERVFGAKNPHLLPPREGHLESKCRHLPLVPCKDNASTRNSPFRWKDRRVIFFTIRPTFTGTPKSEPRAWECEAQKKKAITFSGLNNHIVTYKPTQEPLGHKKSPNNPLETKCLNSVETAGRNWRFLSLVIVECPLTSESG